MCSELKKKQGVRAGGSDRTLDSSIAREDLRSKPVPVWKGRLEISVVVGPTATRPGTLWNTSYYSGTLYFTVMVEMVPRTWPLDSGLDYRISYFTFMLELVPYSQYRQTLNPLKMECLA